MATLELTLAASCRRTRCSLQPPQLLSSPGIPPCSERCPCGRAPPAYEPTPCSAERREQRREESVRETGSSPQARLTTISRCQSGVLAWCAAVRVIHPIATLMHLKLLSGLCPCWCLTSKYPVAWWVFLFACLLFLPAVKNTHYRLYSRREGRSKFSRFQRSFQCPKRIHWLTYWHNNQYKCQGKREGSFKEDDYVYGI